MYHFLETSTLGGLMTGMPNGFCIDRLIGAMLRALRSLTCHGYRWHPVSDHFWVLGAGLLGGALLGAEPVGWPLGPTVRPLLSRI